MPERRPSNSRPPQAAAKTPAASKCTERRCGIADQHVEDREDLRADRSEDALRKIPQPGEDRDAAGAAECPALRRDDGFGQRRRHSLRICSLAALAEMDPPRDRRGTAEPGAQHHTRRLGASLRASCRYAQFLEGTGLVYQPETLLDCIHELNGLGEKGRATVEPDTLAELEAAAFTTEPPIPPNPGPFSEIRRCGTTPTAGLQQTERRA